MANYMMIMDWQTGPVIEAEEKPIGFDNSPSQMLLDIGELSYEDAKASWLDLAKIQYPERMLTYILAMREREYLIAGITKESLGLALWEAQMEGKTDALNALQAKREAIKLKYPKP